MYDIYSIKYKYDNDVLLPLCIGVQQVAPWQAAACHSSSLYLSIYLTFKAALFHSSSHKFYNLKCLCVWGPTPGECLSPSRCKKLSSHPYCCCCHCLNAFQQCITWLACMRHWHKGVRKALPGCVLWQQCSVNTKQPEGNKLNFLKMHFQIYPHRLVYF